MKKHNIKLKYILTFFWLTFTVICIVPGANSQVTDSANVRLNTVGSSSANNSDDGQYMLNGHKFVVNSKLNSPFIETFILNKLGYGRSIDLDIPAIRISGTEVIQVEGELLFTSINFRYQQKIKDWMAFNANVEILGRLGDQAGSLISEGVNVATLYELGLLARLYENKEFYLSGGLSIGNQEVTVINLQEFLQEVIDSGKITKDNRLIETVPIFRGGAKILGSYAFNKVFGSTFVIEYLLGETYSRDQGTNSFFNYGFGFDADLNPAYEIPVGFLLGFYANEYPDAADKLQGDPVNFLFQINYTGESDLNLGLEFNYLIYKPEDFDKNIKLLKTEFGLRYFF